MKDDPTAGVKPGPGVGEEKGRQHVIILVLYKRTWLKGMLGLKQ